VSDAQQDQPPAASAVPPAGPLVRQSHGGAINRGGYPRLLEPTVADVAANAQRYLYRELPKLRRMAANKPALPRGKKRGTPKPPFTPDQQLRAFAELRKIAVIDRVLRETRVAAFLTAVRDEIYEYLPREQADGLLSKIAPHALDI
jgi:hypothetical protein